MDPLSPILCCPERNRIFLHTTVALCDPVNKGADEYGATPLHHTVQDGAVWSLEVFLHLGLFPVNGVNHVGHTALTQALQTPAPTTYDLVRLLLSHGADPNFHSSLQPPPLFLAILFQEKRTIDLLLAAGADPVQRLGTDGLFLKSGETALSLATRLPLLGLPLSSPLPLQLPYLLLLGTLLRSPTVHPTAVFHALQQTRDPVLKKYILDMNRLNLPAC